MIPSREPRSLSHNAYLAAQQARVSQLNDELKALFPEPAEVVLEIGCGHGHYLTAYAQQHPESHCLGMDLVTKRIEKACQKRDKRNLAHLHFFKADAAEFLMALPDYLKLERVFILFPDPWPKKRHLKNRIVQAPLLNELARHARIGTALHFRTDHEDYFDWGIEAIASHPLWSIDDETEWPFENPSYFQDLFTGYQSLTAILTEA